MGTKKTTDKDMRSTPINATPPVGETRLERHARMLKEFMSEGTDVVTKRKQ